MDGLPSGLSLCFWNASRSNSTTCFMLRLRSGQGADTGDFAAGAGLLHERDDRATAADQPLVVAGRVTPGLGLDARGRVARVLRARDALVAERAEDPRVDDDGRARGG